MASTNGPDIPAFNVLDTTKEHTFIGPAKRIEEGCDLSTFLVSHAYRDIIAFIRLLNRSLFPVSSSSESSSDVKSVQRFPTDRSTEHVHPTVKSTQALLADIDAIIQKAPPDTGPRRFGNISFRKWSKFLEECCESLLSKHLPQDVLAFKHGELTAPVEELRPYLLGAFGSPQRLDYGTGHELSFLAFVGCIWKLGGFGASPAPEVSRQIVIGIMQPYFVLVRKLIMTYTLEPAGSHGVWGLDDHSFLPYVFGSAQLGPVTLPTDPTPTEGSVKGAPDPAKVTSKQTVEEQRSKNMYFDAIGFIYDVKKGPFWEHSPTLYDISGVRAGWGKINKGMLKMYDAEVLGKFPVVQHFPFGSLFSFDEDPQAKPRAVTEHGRSQPRVRKGFSAAHVDPGRDLPNETLMKAPWAMSPSADAVMPSPRDRFGSAGLNSTATESSARSSTSGPAITRAPWAK